MYTLHGIKMAGANTAGFIMVGIIWRIFWKLRFIIYDNDVIRNISAGKIWRFAGKTAKLSHVRYPYLSGAVLYLQMIPLLY